MLLDEVTVEHRRQDGSIAGAQVRVLDFDQPENNDWLAGELLRKPLSGEITSRSRKNVVQARSFRELLDQVEVLSEAWAA